MALDAYVNYNANKYVGKPSDTLAADLPPADDETVKRIRATLIARSTGINVDEIEMPNESPAAGRNIQLSQDYVDELNRPEPGKYISDPWRGVRHEKR